MKNRVPIAVGIFATLMNVPFVMQGNLVNIIGFFWCLGITVLLFCTGGKR